MVGGAKSGVKVVRRLLEQGEEVRRREEAILRRLRLWLFAHDGVSGEAKRLLEQHGVLWSSRAELDGLLEAVQLRKLPLLA